MTAICEICDKEFKTTQGLRGHKTFVHQMGANHDPHAQISTKQEQDLVGEELERLHIRIEQVDKVLGNLVSKVSSQAEQINNLKVQPINAQSVDQKLGREITRIRYDLDQLEIKLERLSRFVQYEFAGVKNDIIWELHLDRPDLRRYYKQ